MLTNANTMFLYNFLTVMIAVCLLVFILVMDKYTKNAFSTIRIHAPQPNSRRRQTFHILRQPRKNSSQFSDMSGTTKEPKLILYWAPSGEGFNYLHLKKCNMFRFEDLQCPVSNCEWTDDRSVAYDADAIVFLGMVLETMPGKRNPKTRWIWANHEAPCHSTFPSEWVFNWTMTYRKDSDIFSPYPSQKCHRDSVLPIKRDFVAVARGKTKLAAWAVSNCHARSKRMEYVKELQRYMDVDIYGSCGPLRCGRNREEKCQENFNNNYKFYLSFENSFAKDYVTEKFYKVLPLDIIPVTRSGANYTSLGIPPFWHIDSHDFKTPKDLADYLKALDKDDDQYAKLLEAKSGLPYTGWLDVYCKICEKLNSPAEPVKWYSSEDLRRWFGTCEPPDDLQFATRNFLQLMT